MSPVRLTENREKELLRVLKDFKIIGDIENNFMQYASLYIQTKITDADIYINDKKIGSIGLRIKKNCSYHGLSLNNDMDLRPFDHINTCGYPDLNVTQLSDLGVNVSANHLANSIIHAITQALQS
jgi:lipoate-protein ligase B